ncbi:LuxR C-terminal-related transcriptional regulator [Microbacterium sp. CFBP9023]|uniref:helix-turn-helix transcriptional regulator n=1 Tax=Microbacterium sp. CFBP9023 TaxID=3096535 RepID=UPI002A69F369|nr:LuxR C-terminal-related transcriptional regulator [Microbacterium sp. CFBP9023]MDY0983587.1 LuxR C-terminal-related transcriptional regulator [Microbacterium sp. CFBP9023]
MSIEEHAGPAGSRRLAADHALALAEQRDRYALTLESLLATLRSQRLDDRAARTIAVDVAAGALVGLRTHNDEQGAGLEPVTGAFERLRGDLRPLVRYSELDVQFVEPPANGRALPGVIAHSARSIVRSTVLAIVDRGETRRVRIQWDCDGLNLLIAIRDDGRGDLTTHDDALRPIAEQVSALSGDLSVASTPGWGSEVGIRLPLDPPAEPGDLPDAIDASPRERDVLRLVSAGRRNREIAETLNVSENTVKFHVSNLLRKSGVASRVELAAIARG